MKFKDTKEFVIQKIILGEYKVTSTEGYFFRIEIEDLEVYCFLGNDYIAILNIFVKSKISYINNVRTFNNVKEKIQRFNDEKRIKELYA